MLSTKIFSVALLAVALVASAFGLHAAEPAKKIKVGMIGLDTSHCIAFTKYFQDPKSPKELSEVVVVAGYPGGSPDLPQSWSRVKDITEKVRGMGVEIVDSIDELLNRCDAVMLESVDGRVHLAQATAVINAGKPLYIDKPLANSSADAVKILRLAKEKNVPCFSASSLRFGLGIQNVRDGKSEFGDVRGCNAWSPAQLDPAKEPFWFHGMHGVEILFTVMGPGCKTVTCAKRDQAAGQWSDGRRGVFTAKKNYGATIEGAKKTGDTKKYTGYVPMLVEVVKFFKTGKSPINPDETLEIIAFMEAADQSLSQNGAPVELDSILKKVK